MNPIIQKKLGVLFLAFFVIALVFSFFIYSFHQRGIDLLDVSQGEDVVRFVEGTGSLFFYSLVIAFILLVVGVSLLVFKKKGRRRKRSKR